jgi:hypothetical protein
MMITNRVISNTNQVKRKPEEIRPRCFAERIKARMDCLPVFGKPASRVAAEKKFCFGVKFRFDKAFCFCYGKTTKKLDLQKSQIPSDRETESHGSREIAGLPKGLCISRVA